MTAPNFTGPVAVAGHDIGSMVAFAWAAAHPEDISHPILLDSLLPGLGLEEAMNVAEGGMWHFGFFMSPHVPEMLFDGHELEFFTATFTATSNPGTFGDHDLAGYAQAYTGRERLRGGFEHYRTLLDDGRENRAPLAERKLPMPVLAARSFAEWEIMNIVLWVIAALLAAAFLFSGLFKLALSHEKYIAAQDWAAGAPRWAPHAIGMLEVLGAIGVVLPAMVDIAPPLVPIAATGLALVMIGAVTMHLRRKEIPALAPSGVLLILAATVAWGRFGPYAF